MKGLSIHHVDFFDGCFFIFCVSLPLPICINIIADDRELQVRCVYPDLMCSSSFECESDLAAQGIDVFKLVVCDGCFAAAD